MGPRTGLDTAVAKGEKCPRYPCRESNSGPPVQNVVTISRHLIICTGSSTGGQFFGSVTPKRQGTLGR
jgi:hypothetical protein